MKNIKLRSVVLLLSLLIFTISGCKKDDTPDPVLYKAAVPANPTPANDAVVPLAGTSYTLTWEGDATIWDVYVGTTDPPTLAQAGVNGKSYTFTTTTGGAFFWQVVTTDGNGIVSTSPVWNFFINSPPSIPVLDSPENDSVGFPVSGALEWSCTDAEGDALTFDVYIDSINTPGIVAADLADPTYSPSLVASTKYYWKVVAKDPHGGTSTSILKSFTTGLEPIMTFTGDYTADEPAEAYSYDVTFTKASATSIQTDNYWNSGWTAEFTIDLVNLTYSMPYTEWTSVYSGNESGIIDPATGTMTGTYTIFKNGVSLEQGVHTYTKK
jgi:hypothetical protein